VEATSLVCVDGVAVLYSGRWFAQGTSAGQHIGQHTLAWAENHLRYLACGQTLQPLCTRLCSHDRNHLVWTDGGHSSSAPTGPAFASTNRLPAKEVRIGLPAVAASTGREMVPSVQDPIAYGLVGDRVGEMNANEYHECRFGPERAQSFCVQEHDRQPAMASRNKLESLGACELGTSSIKVNLTAHMNLVNTRGDCARTHRRHLRRAR